MRINWRKKKKQFSAFFYVFFLTTKKNNINFEIGNERQRQSMWGCVRMRKTDIHLKDAK